MTIADLEAEVSILRGRVRALEDRLGVTNLVTTPRRLPSDAKFWWVGKVSFDNRRGYAYRAHRVFEDGSLSGIDLGEPRETEASARADGEASGLKQVRL